MNRSQFSIATAIGVCCLAVLAGNVVLTYGNKAAQADIAVRQQYVQQSVQLEGLYREIVRALAELGARNNDGEVKTLLQRHGITYSVNAAAPTPAPLPAVATPAAPRK